MSFSNDYDYDYDYLMIDKRTPRVMNERMMFFLKLHPMMILVELI